MANKIIVYTKNNCPNCLRAKMLFESCPVEVEIEERNIEIEPSYRMILENELNSQTLPTFVFRDEYGDLQAVIRGFDEGEIMTELGL
ncbi:glutaredoxin domain-containing protein [Bacillus sp. AFS075034]|uniref:glutaredoxin family protein n=1 Tax=Bacillus sp. AFS075034 TaxID=2034281 RepID=UPI000BF94ABC|nr:glutaredoxin domain-containing protein [Bacillus sp. AFS075034]PFW61602.1 NrdH-redoxin [Bacillus sp. AFS075034]